MRIVAQLAHDPRHAEAVRATLAAAEPAAASGRFNGRLAEDASGAELVLDAPSGEALVKAIEEIGPLLTDLEGVAAVCSITVPSDAPEGLRRRLSSLTGDFRVDRA